MFRPTRPIAARINRVVEVRLREPDAADHFISTTSHTINVSETGLLMEVPTLLDACVGQDVIACIHWDGGSFESPGRIARFESPYWKDGVSSVLGVELKNALPEELLTPAPAA